MDGIYNSKKILKSFNTWKDSNYINECSWENNHLHIDELQKKIIDRSEWLSFSVWLINLIHKNIKSDENLKLFLLIELKWTRKKIDVDNCTLKWVCKNLHICTPPSLNYCSLEYFSDFYLKELIKITPDKDFINIFEYHNKLEFYSHIYYNKFEHLFINDIYIFI